MSRSGIARLDPADEGAARVAERLETQRVAWLTTVAADGTPQTSPIWFIWDGEEFLIYSLDSVRVRNLVDRSRVSLNLDGNGMGGDIVVIEGTARVDETVPSVAENPLYLAKYQPIMDERGWTPAWFAGRYSVPIRVTPTKYRFW